MTRSTPNFPTQRTAQERRPLISTFGRTGRQDDNYADVGFGSRGTL